MKNLLKVIVTIALASGAASVSAQTSVLNEQLTTVEVGAKKPLVSLNHSGKLSANEAVVRGTKIRLSDDGKLDIAEATTTKTRIRLSDDGKLDVKEVTTKKIKIRL